MGLRPTDLTQHRSWPASGGHHLTTQTQPEVSSGCAQDIVGLLKPRKCIPEAPQGAFCGARHQSTHNLPIAQNTSQILLEGTSGGPLKAPHPPWVLIPASLVSAGGGLGTHPLWISRTNLYIQFNYPCNLCNTRQSSGEAWMFSFLKAFGTLNAHIRLVLTLRRS